MNYSNCFPSDWIGKKLVRVNDSCYFVNGDSTKQVAVPFGHKGVSARWLPNGVLRIDTDSNVSYFFVGSQRFFEAYGDETEPHDIQSYRKAVEECRRFRAEKKGQKMAATNEQKSNNHITDNKGGKNNKSRLGLGALVGGAIASIKELHNIDKPSDELIATSQSILDSMYQEQEQMAERWRRDEEKSNKAWERRNKEIDELRKADQVNSAREKKVLFLTI